MNQFIRDAPKRRRYSRKGPHVPTTSSTSDAMQSVENSNNQSAAEITIKKLRSAAKKPAIVTASNNAVTASPISEYLNADVVYDSDNVSEYVFKYFYFIKYEFDYYIFINLLI